jgi:hypothetical protein
MRLVFVMACCVLTFTTRAQEHRHEAAVDIVPALRRGNALGLMYRLHNPAVSWRLQGLLVTGSQKSTVNPNSGNPPVANGKQNKVSDEFTGNIQAGFQKNLTSGTWNFYLGADLFFESSETLEESETFSSSGFGNSRNKVRVETSRTGYGVAPLAGLSFFPHPQFSISVENSVRLSSYSFTNSRKEDYYFTPVKGKEGLIHTAIFPESGEGTRFEFDPAQFMRLYLGYRF